MDKKMVLSISRCANHNGPGLRTLILFKGCPARCIWCSTPESQKVDCEIGLHVPKCSLCEQCIPVCPVEVITKQDNKILIDRNRCTYCCKCYNACHWKAIKIYGKKMSVQEIVRQIEKDTLIFKNSGGGATFSGGEPLYTQPEFNRDLFKACKDKGISVGVQTCGHVPWDHIEIVLPYVDFFLWDIKHMDPEKHKAYTGITNTLLLDNLRRVSELGTPLHIRVPVIPGYNDSEENIKAICEFVNGLRPVKAFDLLPLHHIGKSRYESLDREYPIDNIPLISNERIEELKNIVEDCGIPCRIGGS